MKILIAAFTTALLVFTLATTWTDMIQPRIDVLTAATSTKNVDVSSNSKLSPNKRSTTDTNDELDSDDDSPRNANKSRRGALGKSDLNSNRIRDELERAKQQELKLAAREETLRILFDDIRTEMAVVDEIRRRTSTDLSLAARRVSETVVSNSTMDAVPTDESVNVASTQSPKPTGQSQTERLSFVVQRLANPKTGSVRIAAAVLSGIKEREAAKVLSALNDRDPVLASQLAVELQASKDQPIRR